MEQDMDKAIAPILCTKIDGKAGDWPSESFVRLFLIARKCVQKIQLRPEMTQVRGSSVTFTGWEEPIYRQQCAVSLRSWAIFHWQLITIPGARLDGITVCNWKVSQVLYKKILTH